MVLSSGTVHVDVAIGAQGNTFRGCEACLRIYLHILSFIYLFICFLVHIFADEGNRLGVNKPLTSGNDSEPFTHY